jgi:GTPase involved in cell partitioning and DNA repair
MSDLYEVEKIVDKRKRFGKNEYKVKWLGYKMSECTWEPLEHLLNVMDEVEKYEKSIKKGKINLENNKIEKKIKNTNEEEKANVYYIDNRYKNVITISSINQNLYGIVQFDNNGIIEEKKILTSDLKKLNPFILINFYESKIKFT